MATVEEYMGQAAQGVVGAGNPFYGAVLVVLVKNDDGSVVWQSAALGPPETGDELVKYARLALGEDASPPAFHPNTEAPGYL